VAAAGKQLGRLRRALDILRGDAADHAAGQILQQADAAALRRERRIARDARLRRAVGQIIGREVRRRAVQLDMLDAAGDLRPRRLGKLELVEGVAGNAVAVVRIP